MPEIALKEGADLAGFRRAVRILIARSVRPDEVIWSVGSIMGFNFEDETLEPIEARPVQLPRGVGEMIDLVVCHRDPERYALLYRLVWRVTHGEKHLLEVASDPLVHRLMLIVKSVRRDLHKMHAFLRFRAMNDPVVGERYVAWFEPEHFIVEQTAGFFVERFQSMHWSIFTPVGSLHWDRKTLRIGPPGKKTDAPERDNFETGWADYFRSTFNPARTNPDLMRQHMPKKYWKNMPETAAIPDMIREARSRVEEMIEQELVAPLKRNPEKAVAAMGDEQPKSLEALNRIIIGAEPFVDGGSARAVLGEGPMHPSVAFVGEQPGDQEDLQGRPFVGPAGQLLDRALKEADFERAKAYVTNAVKHFKFVQRGKRRLHQTPTQAEVKHYRWWLQRELDFVDPGLVVALGATAALALTGKPVPVTKNRGPFEFEGRRGYLTVHPSSLLRIQDADEMAEAWRAFVSDMKRIREISMSSRVVRAAE